MSTLSTDSRPLAGTFRLVVAGLLLEVVGSKYGDDPYETEPSWSLKDIRDGVLWRAPTLPALRTNTYPKMSSAPDVLNRALNELSADEHIRGLHPDVGQMIYELRRLVSKERPQRAMAGYEYGDVIVVVAYTVGAAWLVYKQQIIATTTTTEVDAAINNFGPPPRPFDAYFWVLDDKVQAALDDDTGDIDAEDSDRRDATYTAYVRGPLF